MKEADNGWIAAIVSFLKLAHPPFGRAGVGIWWDGGLSIRQALPSFGGAGEANGVCLVLPYATATASSLRMERPITRNAMGEAMKMELSVPVTTPMVMAKAKG